MKRMSGIRISFCLVAMALIANGLSQIRFTSLQVGVDTGVRQAQAMSSTSEAAENSGRAYLGENDVVTATGIGKIASLRAASRMSARRAALSDARRNLLIEARRIREGIQGKSNISGHVDHHWIVSERREGNLYKVTLAARLSDLRVD
jgi:hypothetical protein